MKKYIFKSGAIKDEYRYIFLCGAKFQKYNKADKRIVLREFLREVNDSFRIIILEDNFVFARDSKKFLVYDDIHMKDLYQVEMLTSYLADTNIIIHESISTGAEIGLFLSEQLSLKKTCLLLPDEMALEEDKLGQFLRLAFLRKEPRLKTITYYPRVEKNILSENVKRWHSFFYQDKVGENLGEELKSFIYNGNIMEEMKFSSMMEDVPRGIICYKVMGRKLEIIAIPRMLTVCVAAILNIEEMEEKIINADENTFSEYIDIIKQGLSQVFINTIEEKTGKEIDECSIKAKMNMTGVYISHIIGMILYLFQAAGFISIVKSEDYATTRNITIKRKIVTSENEQYFFYQKYSELIDSLVDKRIV